MTPLYMASSGGHLEIVKTLLAAKRGEHER